jgi:hypothetical protein
MNMREGKVWKEWNYDGWCHLAGIFQISFESDSWMLFMCSDMFLSPFWRKWKDFG